MLQKYKALNKMEIYIFYESNKYMSKFGKQSLYTVNLLQIYLQFNYNLLLCWNGFDITTISKCASEKLF